MFFYILFTAEILNTKMPTSGKPINMNMHAENKYQVHAYMIAIHAERIIDIAFTN